MRNSLGVVFAAWGGAHLHHGQHAGLLPLVVLGALVISIARVVSE